MILDEIQYTPQLLPLIKKRIDEERTPGRWILTGSQQFQLMQNITESLAGRVAVFTLLPFSLGEFVSARKEFSLGEWIFTGGYPEVVVRRELDVRLWMNSYIQTYLERDVRNLRNIGDLQQFQRFLKLIAARSSRVLNYSEISRDAGITVPTVKQWISVLQAGQLIALIPPYYRNVGKRLIKSPKVYLLDTGLMAALLGYRSGEEILNGPLAGAFFETALVSEFYKSFYHLGQSPAIYFWRTRTGHEVDVLIERNGKLLAFEIKLTATPTPVHQRPLTQLREILGPDTLEQMALVCTVSRRLPLPGGMTALPWKEVPTFIQTYLK
ncbi:MAG: ATP-binding protein [Calditrichaeota bacterium]|nr:MAG: ATP-binding protein [Calditrichota bacterium]